MNGKLAGKKGHRSHCGAVSPRRHAGQASDSAECEPNADLCMCRWSPGGSQAAGGDRV